MSEPPVRRSRMAATQRREAIIHATLPLFARHGFDGVTTRQLAEAAGISEALIFRHFPTKLDLFVAIYEDWTDHFELDYTKITAMPDSTASLVRLVYFVTRSIILKRAPNAHASLRLLYRSFVEDGAFAKLVFRGVKTSSLIKKFGSCIEAAELAGDIDVPLPDSANLYWFTHHIASAACLFRLPEPPSVRYRGGIEAAIRQMSQFALRGAGLSRAAEARLIAPDTFAQFLKNPELNLLRPLV